ncbi:MAG: glycosyltransferase [Clostridia bacterium]|nr:glycosyltransferase [Clostridia bacterium]
MDLKIGLFNESFPPTVDGVANAVYNYAKNIDANHGRVTVVTPKYPNVIDDYPFEVYRYGSFDVSKKLGYRVGNVLSLKTYNDLINEKFDLIHIHSPFASSVIADLVSKFRHKVPIVFTYHTKYDIDIKKRIPTKAFQKIAMKFLLRNINLADEVWVVTEGAAESLRNIGYTGKYRVMENGTDFPLGRADDKIVDKIRAQYGLDKNQLTFLFVGRMMWYKNVGLILDALKLVADDIDFKMVFVGDGVDRPAIEQYAKRIGLGDKTVFAGTVYDREVMRGFFSSADLFMFPSTYDTAGLVVKEAAACELPSILVEKSCAAEGVQHDFSGFLCSETAEDMADKIKCAVKDKEHLREVGKNAQKYVYLSWEDAVKRAYNRYEEIAFSWPKDLPYRRNEKEKK